MVRLTIICNTELQEYRFIPTFPDIFPHEPVNNMDVRFLNYSKSPLVSPLHKSIKIKILNYMYFQPITVSVNKARKYEASN